MSCVCCMYRPSRSLMRRLPRKLRQHTVNNKMCCWWKLPAASSRTPPPTEMMSLASNVQPMLSATANVQPMLSATANLERSVVVFGRAPPGKLLCKLNHFIHAHGDCFRGTPTITSIISSLAECVCGTPTISKLRCSSLNSRSAVLLLHGGCVRGTPTTTRLSLSSELRLGLAGLGWHPTRMQVLISATQLGLLGRYGSSRRARSRQLCCRRCLASDRIW